MKNINQFKKFQFFEMDRGDASTPEEKKLLANMQTIGNAPKNYVLSDVVPITMKIQDKMTFLSCRINDGKLKNDKKTLFRLLRLQNNQILDEYSLFTDTLIEFSFAEVQGRKLLVALGTDIISIPNESKSRLNLNKIKPGLCEEKEPFVIPTENSMPCIKIYNFSKFLGGAEGSEGALFATKNENKNTENNTLTPNGITPDVTIYLSKHKNKEEMLNVLNENEAANGEALKGIKFMAVSGDLSVIAVSTDTERIVVVKGIKESLAFCREIKDRKIGIVKIPDKNPATNISLTGGNYLIFTTCENIFLKRIAEKDGETQQIGTEAEHKGASEHNFGLGNMNNFIIATSNDGYLEEYMDLDKGRSWFFDKTKKFVQFYRDYLLFVIVEEKKQTLCVYDCQNNIFVYYDERPNIVHNIFTTSDRIYVLTEETGSKRKLITCLKEKDNKDKFDAFYRKSFFDNAYQYAKSLRYEPKKISEINKLHAEFLYKKNEFEKAIDQYKQTINFLDPSYVIQKFLDGSKLNYLIDYLEALQKNEEFKNNCAPERLKDFTALLLNCYIKQKQINKLKEFVLKKEIDENAVKTAIEVCKDSSKTDIAKYIAKKKGMTEMYVQILMDSQYDYADSLDEIARCENLLTQFNILIKYGEKFIKHETNTVSDLITKVVERIIDIKNDGVDQDTLFKTYKPEQIIEIKRLKYQKIVSVFAGEKNKEKLENFLDKVMEKEKKYADQREKTQPKIIVEAIQPKKKKKHEEEIILGCPSEIILRKIELLLGKPSSYNKTREISNIIETYKDQVDRNYLMLLFKETGYDEGINLLFKDENIGQEKFQNWLNSTNTGTVTEEDTMKMLNESPNLGANNWLQILNHIVSQGVIDSNKEKTLISMLKVLEQSGDISPLTVLNLLAVKRPGKKMPFRIVKEYLINWIRKQKSAFEEEQNLTDENYKKVIGNEEELKELQKRGRPLKNPKCALCAYALDFPFIYFGCEHAFHQTCYNSEVTDYDEFECSKCKSKNQQCIQRINDGRSLSKNENAFNTDLKQKPKKKKFDFMCEYLGKGVFFQEEEEKKEAEDPLQNLNSNQEDNYGNYGGYGFGDY